MSKRLATTLSDDPFARKRVRKSFWVGAQCWQYDKRTNSSRLRTTFLDLPLELREQIYEDVLEDVVKPIEHLYDELPEHAKFEPYLTLRLLNQQVSREVKGVWKKRFEHRLVFYFDNPPALFDLWTEVKHHPRLRNAHFFLRAENFDADEGKQEPGDSLLTDTTELLMEFQLGWKEEWVECPGYFKHSPRDSWGNPMGTRRRWLRDARWSPRCLHFS